MRALANIFWLGTKELRSFIHDYVLVGLVVWAFSLAVYAQAQSRSQELHNAAIAVIDEVARPNVRLQLDLYHVQIMEGDLATKIRALAGRYPHVQIAGNPGRHEPDVGEINYPFLFDLFDEIGYQGWIGCEYRPSGDTVAGLGWAKKYGIG